MTYLDHGAKLIKGARAKMDAAMKYGADAATAAQAEGMSEVEIARALGVNRTTVRRWLGKQ